MADGSGGAASDAADGPLASPDAESLLDLRDRVLGVQAQLDEIHSRLDRLEARVEAHEAALARPGLVARARSRAGRARVTVVRRVRRSA